MLVSADFKGLKLARMEAFIEIEAGIVEILSRKKEV